MIPAERKNKIIDILSKKNFITTNELSKKLFVSEPTVRRDLIDLEKQRLIIRLHGGATIANKSSFENSYLLRTKENADKKAEIAEIASTFIDDGNTIFLDSSTTVNSIISYITNFKDLTIVTNGLKNAMDLSIYPRINTIMIGGSVYHNSSSIIGEKAISFVSNYNVDLCFISCRGLDNKGLYEANEPQALLKQKMLENSRQKILLADSSKFEQKYFYYLARYSDIDYLITDDTDYFTNNQLDNQTQFIEA